MYCLCLFAKYSQAILWHYNTTMPSGKLLGISLTSYGIAIEIFLLLVVGVDVSELIGGNDFTFLKCRLLLGALQIFPEFS